MEDAIVQNPKRYLGEDGIELVERQYRIGGYIFDLLFKDRYGAKLIVEIQKGTLDRNHTYKILDYYDGFKEKHPNDFIELMVIANRIPEERKKRLHAWGVEFREIPEAEFASESQANHNVASTPGPTNHVESQCQSNDIFVEESIMKSYELFKKQKNRFVEELRHAEKDISITLDWKDLNPKNIRDHKNWFVCFVPKSWGVSKKGWGVHFGFYGQRDKRTKIEYVRFPVGVEKPLKPEFHDKFKDDVVTALKQRNIVLTECAVWPNAGPQKAKLIEPARVVLDNSSWEEVLKRYLGMSDFIQVVAEVIRKYYDNGCFTEDFHF
jgi:hypothetical protein